MAQVCFSLWKVIKSLENFSTAHHQANNFFLRKNPSSQQQFYETVKKGKPAIFGGTALGKSIGSQAHEEVVHSLTMAIISLKDGDLERSEKMLLTGLNLAEAINFPPGVVSACDILSSLSMKAKDYERAEEFLRRVSDNLTGLGMPEDDNVSVGFGLKLARVHGSNGNRELAEIGYENCIRLLRKKLENRSDEETNVLWITVLYWYGKFLFGERRFREAKTCFRECHLASSKLNNRLLPGQRMVILYHLGEICQILGEHDEAFDYLADGISMDEKNQNPDLAYFYVQLGRISMWRELYRDAEDWCFRGNQLARRHGNSDAERESNDCLEKIKSVLVC